ncbi:MAG TPA: transposase [Verrucomicrobiae bacterium]
MGKRAKAGACLEALVKMAIPLLQEAERQCPRTGPGAKPEIPDWLIGVLIMVAVLKRKKTKAAQFRYVTDPANRPHLAAALGRNDFPARSGWYRRYRRAHQLFETGIRLQGELAIAEGIADPRHLAVDKSLIEAQGPRWHKRDRERNKVPAGVDRDSTWGYSEHDGWVQGFSYEVVVSATKNTVVFPLLASVDTASAAEVRTFADKIRNLPAETQTVSLDSGYDANALAEDVEWDDRGRRTGRRFLCPENPRHSGRTKTKDCGADASRAPSRKLRRQRKKYWESSRGRRLYARRKKTVEPFNQWFKSLFELDLKVWHRGLQNNRTQILASIFTYQLLIRFNHRCGRPNGRLRWIMDAL